LLIGQISDTKDKAVVVSPYPTSKNPIANPISMVQARSYSLAMIVENTFKISAEYANVDKTSLSRSNGPFKLESSDPTLYLF
jgi:hypothetical protein